jgi:hypothetical protein
MRPDSHQGLGTDIDKVQAVATFIHFSEWLFYDLFRLREFIYKITKGYLWMAKGIVKRECTKKFTLIQG